MGLRETVQKLAQTAIKATGNIAINFNWERGSTQEFNSGTRLVEDVDGISEQGIPIVLTEIISGDFDRFKEFNPKSTDVIGLVASLDLPNDLIPKKNDTLDDGTVYYQLMGFLGDPAGATWSLLIRETK